MRLVRCYLIPLSTQAVIVTGPPFSRGPIGPTGMVVAVPGVLVTVTDAVRNTSEAIALRLMTWPTVVLPA